MQISVSDTIFQIQKISKAEAYFPNWLIEYLNSYIDYCKKNNVSSAVLESVSRFKDCMYKCTLDYCSGQHANAKAHLSEALEAIPVADICRPVRDSVLYRARINKRKFYELIPKKYSPEEMFHIPFELRYLVRTERYSYPGLPCLYLGASAKVCCLEISCKSKYLNIASFSVVSSADFNIIDLCFFDDYNFDDLTEEQANLFYTMWPLVAVCSFRYDDPQKMNFRQDYIIPQLLLEYAIDQNALNALKDVKWRYGGIRYYSTRRMAFSAKGKLEDASEYINYAFPAQDIQERGTCSILKQHFIPLRVEYKKDIL